MSQKIGIVTAHTQSTDFPTLTSIWPVRALMISAMVRTMQMLARWAANPRIIASKTAKTRIAMLHPAWLGAPSVRWNRAPRYLYNGPAERLTIVLSGMSTPGTRRTEPMRHAMSAVGESGHATPKEMVRV